MKISCDVVADLVPLVMDGVASEDTVDLVTEHLKSCEKCGSEYENNIVLHKIEPNDKKVVSSIKKKLFFISSALLLVGGVIGLSLNKNSSSNLIPIIISVITILLVGTLIFKFNLKGDDNMKKFFVGRAIGTAIVFGIIGIYLLVKYLIQLF
ncbi:hypothetical protein D3C81_1234610 [compost metagenome]